MRGCNLAQRFCVSLFMLLHIIIFFGRYVGPRRDAVTEGAVRRLRVRPHSPPQHAFLALPRPRKTPPPACMRPTHVLTILQRFKRACPPHTRSATESHPELTPTPYWCTGAVIGPTGSISARSDLPSLQEGPLELRGRCGAASAAASVAPQGAPGRERVARRRWVLGPF